MSQINLKIAGFDLKGRVSEIAESGFVNIRYARKRVADILTSWIQHLALCHGAPVQYPQTSVLICKDSATQFGAVPDSKDLLEDLLNLFRRGLAGPLHFYPEASRQYAEYNLISQALNNRRWLKPD
jgi:exodeoxyribonuclease V gamma subunit